MVRVLEAITSNHRESAKQRLRELAGTHAPNPQARAILVVTWISLIALPIGVLALKLTGIADGTNFYDFGAYYNAGERIIHGHPLYSWETAYTGVTDLPNSLDRYLYAPITAVIFTPFAYLPYGTAVVAWSAVSITIYLAGITALLRSLNLDVAWWQWFAILTGALGFGPFVVTFIAGQVTGVLAGCLCLAAASFTTEHDSDTWLAGVLTTLPVVFKVYYAPAGAPLLRDNRRLATALATGLVIALGGILLFGVGTTIEYLHVLAAGKGWGAATTPPRAWNINDFHPFYYAGILGFAIRGVLLAAITAVAYRSRQHDFEHVDLYVFSFGLLGVALGAPTLGTMGLVVAVPVIVFLLVTTHRDRPGVFVAVVAATLLIHAHPYVTELLAGIILPRLGVVDSASLIVPVVQPAVWGVLLLFACVSYEYTRR